jgi:hypothetical protein
MTIDVLHLGPTIKESDTHYKQVCMLHAETRDLNEVIAAAPGGAAAGWMLPPVWQGSVTAVDEEGRVLLDEENRPIVETFTTSNPKINKKEQLVWLLVRNIEC